MKVAVLMGGKSFEREVSLASGKVVCEALEEAGHKVVPSTPTPICPTLRSERPRCGVQRPHGKHGEDGTIQSLLEFLGIRSWARRRASAIALGTKGRLHSSLAKYRDLTGEEGCASWPQGVYLARDAFKGMGRPRRSIWWPTASSAGIRSGVKPAHGGSALGVHKVESQEELGEAVLDALSYDEAVNIEQWVDGVELSVSILGTGWDAHALPPVEIVAREGFYDAAARMADDAVGASAPCATSRFPQRGRCPGHPRGNRAGGAGSLPRLQRARPRARRPHLGRRRGPLLRGGRVPGHDRALPVPHGLRRGRPIAARGARHARERGLRPRCLFLGSHGLRFSEISSSMTNYNLFTVR